MHSSMTVRPKADGLESRLFDFFLLLDYNISVDCFLNTLPSVKIFGEIM